eukprot:Rhum_TRINITY_DN15217_c3_g1::Rhum_TRINITY_DN15217_c3_g1_i1::g.144659::m.144659
MHQRAPADPPHQLVGDGEQLAVLPLPDALHDDAEGPVGRCEAATAGSAVVQAGQHAELLLVPLAQGEADCVGAGVYLSEAEAGELHLRAAVVRDADATLEEALAVGKQVEEELDEGLGGDGHVGCDVEREEAQDTEQEEGGREAACEVREVEAQLRRTEDVLLLADHNLLLPHQRGLVPHLFEVFNREVLQQLVQEDLKGTLQRPQVLEVPARRLDEELRRRAGEAVEHDSGLVLHPLQLRRHTPLLLRTLCIPSHRRLRLDLLPQRLEHNAQVCRRRVVQVRRQVVRRRVPHRALVRRVHALRAPGPGRRSGASAALPRILPPAPLLRLRRRQLLHLLQRRRRRRRRRVRQDRKHLAHGRTAAAVARRRCDGGRRSCGRRRLLRRRRRTRRLRPHRQVELGTAREVPGRTRAAGRPAAVHVSVGHVRRRRRRRRLQRRRRVVVVVGAAERQRHDARRRPRRRDASRDEAGVSRGAASLGDAVQQRRRRAQRRLGAAGAAAAAAAAEVAAVVADGRHDRHAFAPRRDRRRETEAQPRGRRDERVAEGRRRRGGTRVDALLLRRLVAAGAAAAVAFVAGGLVATATADAGRHAPLRRCRRGRDRDASRRFLGCGSRRVALAVPVAVRRAVQPAVRVPSRADAPRKPEQLAVQLQLRGERLAGLRARRVAQPRAEGAAGRVAALGGRQRGRGRAQLRRGGGGGGRRGGGGGGGGQRGVGGAQATRHQQLLALEERAARRRVREAQVARRAEKRGVVVHAAAAGGGAVVGQADGHEAVALPGEVVLRLLLLAHGLLDDVAGGRQRALLAGERADAVRQALVRAGEQRHLRLEALLAPLQTAHLVEQPLPDGPAQGELVVQSVDVLLRRRLRAPERPCPPPPPAWALRRRREDAGAQHPALDVVAGRREERQLAAARTRQRRRRRRQRQRQRRLRLRRQERSRGVVVVRPCTADAAHVGGKRTTLPPLLALASMKYRYCS